MKINDVLATDLLVVKPERTLGDVVKAIAQSSRSIFPVVDPNGILLGLVIVDNIRNIMFRPELYERFKVERFMVSAPANIKSDTPMEKIIQQFEDTKAWNLPVVDKQGRYLGFVSKSNVFSEYREVLVDTFAGD
jgi:CIC family chloride channel protein